MSKKHPKLVEGPYGLGAMVAFTPLGGDPDKVKALAKALFNNGLMGFMAGSKPTRFRFLMPVGAVTTTHIDEALGIIEKTLLEIAE